MNVLSLFDGMSCGQIALDNLGVKVDKYFASEIDKYAIKVAKANYPDTIHLGDVRDVKASDLPEIDLLIGGSPCQGFSFAGKHRLNFDDPRSALFFEYVRLLKELKPKYFLLENVRMKQKSQDIISECLGVQPVAVNSNLVSAQNRYRLYWTNITFDIPSDKGIVLKDILEDIDTNYSKGGNLKSYFEKHRRQLVFSENGLCYVGDADIKGSESIKRVYHPDGKSPALLASTGGHKEPKILQYPHGCNKGGLKAQDGKTPSMTTSSWQTNNLITYDEGLSWRKLTPIECERLQTVPDNYTNHVSNTQRYRMLGNGWTVDVIANILKPLSQGTVQLKELNKGIQLKFFG